MMDAQDKLDYLNKAKHTITETWMKGLLDRTFCPFNPSQEERELCLARIQETLGDLFYDEAMVALDVVQAENRANYAKYVRDNGSY
jgi:hypothetical protein